MTDREYSIFFKKQLEYLDNLKKEDQIALILYTSFDLGYEMNEKIIENKSLNNNESFLFITLKKIFENIPPIEKDIILYRGIKDPVYNDDEDYEETIHDNLLFQPNFEKYKNAFISTSTKMKVVSDSTFLGKNGCCIMCINVKSGSRVLPLKKYNALQEFEVLLRPSGTWETVMIDAVKDGVFITYVDYKENEIEIPKLNKDRKLDDDMKKDAKDFLK